MYFRNISTVRLHRFLLLAVLIVLGGWPSSPAAAQDVWAWGANSNGQLGDGTTTVRATPAAVSGLSGVTAIAGGFNHSLALLSDGTVWAWGDNSFGQLGDGTTTVRATPVAVSGLSGVTAIAGGYYHSLALLSDGTVQAWGLNLEGQLGDGTFLLDYPYGRSIPAPVIGLSGVVAISGGYYHSLALLSDGTVWAWGDNIQGQLGDGTFLLNYPYGRSIPAPVSELSGVVAISGGSYHSLALLSDGTVRAWGLNLEGQLGDGTFLTDPPYGRSTPVAVSGLSGVIAISGGYYHSLALLSDGTVRTWGDNSNGQLGDGTFLTDPPYGRSTPVAVSGLSGVVAVAGGSHHSLALTGSASPLFSLSGVITLVDCRDQQQTLTFEFRPVGGGAPFQRSVALDSSGGFQLSEIPAGNYALRVKGTKWLARLLFVNLLTADVTNLEAALPGGDANNDNSVDALDLAVVTDAFNTQLGETLFDAAADLNVDDSVDAFDLAVLIDNFNTEGDA